MNQDRDNRDPPAETDPLVSASYRQIATERAPPELDAKTLMKARAAAADSPFRRFTASWFRPLAFIATLGLSLALVLELTSTMQAPTAPEGGAGRQHDRSAGTESLPGESPDASAGDSPAAPQPPGADDPARVDFLDTMRHSSKQMRDADNAARAAIQASQLPAEASPAGEAAGPRTNAADETTNSCSKEQTRDPAKWWRCITELEQAGRHQEASVEMDHLREAFPDFEPPQKMPRIRTNH